MLCQIFSSPGGKLGVLLCAELDGAVAVVLVIVELQSRKLYYFGPSDV